MVDLHFLYKCDGCKSEMCIGAIGATKRSTGWRACDYGLRAVRRVLSIGERDGDCRI